MLGFITAARRRETAAATAVAVELATRNRQVTLSTTEPATHIVGAFGGGFSADRRVRPARSQIAVFQAFARTVVYAKF
jgi:hypothetical protein